MEGERWPENEPRDNCLQVSRQLPMSLSAEEAARSAPVAVGKNEQCMGTIRWKLAYASFVDDAQ